MNGKQRADKLILGPITVDRLEIQHRKSRLPIVAMQNVGIEIDKRKYFPSHRAKKMRSVHRRRNSRNAGQLEIIFVVEKIKSYASS